MRNRFEIKIWSQNLENWKIWYIFVVFFEWGNKSIGW
jgi:hypothetical protein